jgi:hypothetical protein
MAALAGRPNCMPARPNAEAVKNVRRELRFK